MAEDVTELNTRPAEPTRHEKPCPAPARKNDDQSQQDDPKSPQKDPKPKDPELQEVATVWPELCSAVKAAVVALVRVSR